MEVIGHNNKIVEYIVLSVPIPNKFVDDDFRGLRDLKQK